MTHLADKVLELTAKEILSEVDDSSAEEDEACIHDIMTALPRTTTGDTDHGKVFMVQVCKLVAEVEKRTEVCCRKPQSSHTQLRNLQEGIGIVKHQGGLTRREPVPPSQDDMAIKDNPWQQAYFWCAIVFLHSEIRSKC